MPPTLCSLTHHHSAISAQLGRFEIMALYGPHRPYPDMSPKYPGETLLYIGPLTIALLNHRRMDSHHTPASH